MPCERGRGDAYGGFAMPQVSVLVVKLLTCVSLLDVGNVTCENPQLRLLMVMESCQMWER